MLFFLFTDIFCIFKGKTARYELRNLSNHAICPVLSGSDSLCSTLFCEGRVRHVPYSLVGMVCAEQNWLGTDGSSFICGNGALGMEGRSRGVYSAGCIRRIVHAALLSALICFSVTDEREEPDATGYHGDGNTFQRNQCDIAGSQLFQLCIAGKVRTSHLLDKSFTLGRTRDFFIGMAINLHADHVIRNLRKPGDTRHYLPEKGFYRYVTSANYFGELVEWTGFALLTASPAAWVFVWWTAANLVPRADAIYKRYCEEFGKQAVGSRKRIIPYIY